MKRSVRIAALLGFTGLLGALIATGALAGSSQKSATTPIILGADVSETGWLSYFDVPAMNALKMAVADQNAKGGVLGHPIKLIVEDNKTDQTIEPQVAKDLLSKGAQILILSCGYPHSAPAAFVSETAGALSFSLCSGSPNSGVQGVGPLHFSGGVGTPLEGAIAMEWPYYQKHWRRVYQLIDKADTYTTTMCQYSAQTAASLPGMKIVGKDTFQNADISIAAQISRLKAALKQKVDFIQLCSYPPGGSSAVRQIRAAGINTPIFSDYTFDAYSAIKGIPNLSNFYIDSYAFMYGHNPWPGVDAFFAKYKKTYGSLPSGAIAISGYSIGQALFKAIQMANGSTDGKKVTTELETFRNVPLLVGPTTFTSTLHIALQRSLTILQATNGKWRDLGLFKPKLVPNPFGPGWLK